VGGKKTALRTGKTKNRRKHKKSVCGHEVIVEKKKKEEILMSLRKKEEKRSEGENYKKEKGIPGRVSPKKDTKGKKSDFHHTLTTKRKAEGGDRKPLFGKGKSQGGTHRNLHSRTEGGKETATDTRKGRPGRDKRPLIYRTVSEEKDHFYIVVERTWGIRGRKLTRKKREEPI